MKKNVSVLVCVFALASHSSFIYPKTTWHEWLLNAISIHEEIPAQLEKQEDNKSAEQAVAAEPTIQSTTTPAQENNTSSPAQTSAPENNSAISSTSQTPAKVEKIDLSEEKIVAKSSEKSEISSNVVDTFVKNSSTIISQNAPAAFFIGVVSILGIGTAYYYRHALKAFFKNAYSKIRGLVKKA